MRYPKVTTNRQPSPKSSNRRPQAERDPRTAMLPGLPIRNDDPFYIEREQDKVVLELTETPEQTLVIKGPHQKTSKNNPLLQYLSRAHSVGKQIAFVDLKIFSTEDLERYDRFLTSFAQELVRRLRLTAEVPEINGQVRLVDFMES